MLTVTETIERELNPDEKVALDDSKVCEAFCTARLQGNRQLALEYAKIMMLKAFAVGR